MMKEKGSIIIFFELLICFGILFIRLIQMVRSMMKMGGAGEVAA